MSDDVLEKPATSPISTRKHGDVLIVLSNNPPVNALGAAVRQGLVAAIEQAEGDDSVKALVIACEGQTFFAGADVSEFGTPRRSSSRCSRRSSTASKPVPSQSSLRSTARRSAAGSRWPWPAIIASPIPRRSLARRK